MRRFKCKHKWEYDTTGHIKNPRTHKPIICLRCGKMREILATSKVYTKIFDDFKKRFIHKCELSVEKQKKLIAEHSWNDFDNTYILQNKYDEIFYSKLLKVAKSLKPKKG